MHASDERQEGAAAEPDEAPRMARRSRATARSIEIEAGPALSHAIALRRQAKGRVEAKMGARMAKR